jgi:PAS domain S-box-containing protein
MQALVEAAPDAMVIADADGRIVLVNSQTETVFGYQREELLGQPVELLMPPALAALHQRYRGRYVAQPRTRPMGLGLDLIARRKDGSEFPVEISLSPLHTAAGLLVTAVVRDVTERKLLEAERQQLADERHRRTLEQLRRQDAERAVRDREEFLSIAAHELKTPLTAIKASAQFLERLLNAAAADGPSLTALVGRLTSQIARLEPHTSSWWTRRWWFAGYVTRRVSSKS